MNKNTKSYSQLLKDVSDLKKELKFYKDINNKKKIRFKQINIKNSHNNFYMTKKWKEIRYKVLMKHKLQIGSICQLCKTTTTKLHVDHIQPRSKRPDLELSIDNLQVLCANCNIGKRNYDSTDWSKITDKPNDTEEWL